MLRDVNLEIPAGEFVTFLGPSGCGKTTLLRVIAGFIEPTSGTFAIGVRDVPDVRPPRRPVHLGFQRPTLFPHLSVFSHLAFVLRVSLLVNAHCP